MTIRLSAPSKTFLIGEYAVLSGGPALVLNTEPRFSFTATRGENGVSGIPEGSPAAKWLAQNSSLVANWKIEFSDPHAGRGGFGASSAQFLFVHAFTTFIQSSVRSAAAGYGTRKLWNDFQTLTAGQASGADVLAQTVGRVAEIDIGAVEASATAWPYPDLSFVILRTDQKVQTHQHLAELDREPLQSLMGPAHACVENFGVESAEKFLQHARVFARELIELGLQGPSTLALLNTFKEQSWCKLAKGCGALGADTVLVMFATADEALALEFLRGQGFDIVATSANLSAGLEMNWSGT